MIKNQDLLRIGNQTMIPQRIITAPILVDPLHNIKKLQDQIKKLYKKLANSLPIPIK